MLRSIVRGAGSLVRAIVMVIMLPVSLQASRCHYGKEDISFGKFYKAATNTNRRLLKDIFLILFYRTHVTIVEKWPISVEEYCFDILRWSRRKYRDCFTADERTCLSADVESLQSDVTLFFKLLLKLYDKDNLPESFFNALREIKNLRNRVCHEQLEFTEEMLQSNMDDVKQIIENFLEEVSSAFSIDLSDMKQKYCHEIDEITATPITEEGLSYFEQIEKFRDDIMGKFITYGRRELFSYYSKLKILNPFTWLRDDKFAEMQVDKIFTPLQMKNGNIEIGVESLLEAKPFDEESMETTGIQPTVLILSGIAGCGKTSLCRYLLYDWRTRLGTVSKMNAIDILILLEARNIAVDSLVKHLQRTILKDTCSHFEEKDILQILQKINVLYIIDGMDECSSDGVKLINELFSILGNARVILTTRPEYSASAMASVLDNHLSVMQIKIYGFSETGMITFTSKVFRSLEENEVIRHQQETECLRFFTTTGRRLGSQLKIPLTVALLILLWRDDKSKLANIKSITKLYHEIFKMCTMKMLMRIQKVTSTSSFDLENFVEEWMSELGIMAFDMVRRNDYIITNENKKFLTSVCRKHSVDSIQALSAYLICEVQENLNDIQYVFSFIHKSQMEYLAGQHICNLMISNFKRITKDSNIAKVFDKLKIFKKQNYLEHQTKMDIIKMRNVYMFTMGHLCLQNEVQEELVIEVAEKLLQKGILFQNMPAIWQLVQESECHPTVARMVAEIMSNKFIWKPQAEELCDPMNPTLQLLKYTDYTPLGITIRILGNLSGVKLLTNTGEVEMQPYVNLLPVLECVAKKPAVSVLLRVDQHFYNWGMQETSDDLVVALAPNGKLTSFMGHLGVSGARALQELNAVNEIIVRISDVEAFHALSNSLNSLTKKSILKVVIRLDLPSSIPTTSFPAMNTQSLINIVLPDIADENLTWACEVLAQLNKFYEEIDFVSCSLSYDGAKVLLNSLREKDVIVTKIIIRTFQCPGIQALHELNHLAQSKVEWW